MSDSTTHQRVMNMIARGRLSATDDGEGMQFAQVSLLHDEAKARVERFQQYGFSAHAPQGSEVVVLFVGGGRDHGVIISADNRASRIRGQTEGEVAMYSDEGDYVVLKRGNQVEVQTDHLVVRADVNIIIESPRIIIRAPVIEVEGDLVVRGGGQGGNGNVVFAGNLNVAGEIHASAVYAPGGSVPGPAT